MSIIRIEEWQLKYSWGKAWYFCGIPIIRYVIHSKKSDSEVDTTGMPLSVQESLKHSK